MITTRTATAGFVGCVVVADRVVVLVNGRDSGDAAVGEEFAQQVCVEIRHLCSVMHKVSDVGF